MILSIPIFSWITDSAVSASDLKHISHASPTACIKAFNSVYQSVNTVKALKTLTNFPRNKKTDTYLLKHFNGSYSVNTVFLI